MRNGKSEPARAILLLGSNLGDAKHNVLAALYEIDALPKTRLLERGRLFKTEPWGMPPETEWFVNAAAIIETELSPLELLDAVQTLERRFGRSRQERGAQGYSPRSLDVDIIDYNGLILRTPSLVLPHPRAHERRFVLTLLAELMPEWRHPELGLTAADLLARCQDPAAVEPLEPN